MKILHLGKFCPTIIEGGIENFCSDLLEYFNSKGIKADLLCFDRNTFQDKYKGFHFFACETNFKLYSAPISKYYFTMFKQIAKYYDIIHIHSPNPLAEFLAIHANKKIIIHWHSDIVKQKFIYYFFYRSIQRRVLKKADRIICTSPQYLETSKQLLKFKDKAIVIPLGLNPARLNNHYPEDKNLEMIMKQISNKQIILSIGRLVEYKGFNYLIESANYLPKDKVILIAGEGPMYKKLNNKIKKLHLENKVYLLGKIRDISTLIKKSDLFCLTSVTRNEAFGLVLLEALYFGKPIITTNVEGSGMNYVNRNDITGMTVPVGNPEMLASSINKILSDKKLYNTFSKNALERFKEFDISSIGEKILKLYKELLS